MDAREAAQMVRAIYKVVYEMNIASKSGYPAGALSNFAPHPFELDGVMCASAEGWLQSLKYKNPLMQEHICLLVGKKAKFSGSKKNWYRTQTLWWKGNPIKRDSKEYQELLDRAYDALAINNGFRKALLATHNATLTHSIGRTDPKKTILTRSEFCSRLTRLRRKIKDEENKKT